VLTALTFRQFADIYKEPHLVAKKLATGKTIDYRLKPIAEYFGDRLLADIRTADVEDFIADLRKPRFAGRRKMPRILAPASINRTIELLRHMMTWAVGRAYIDRTPFRRGTETLVRKLREDNQRRRRVSEDEEGRLLAVAPPLLRSMIIAALDTSMRQREILGALVWLFYLGPKCRFANAQPDPVFRYFSNRTADGSSRNSITTIGDQGR
jgi:hypothetical protein